MVQNVQAADTIHNPALFKEKLVRRGLVSIKFPGLYVRPIWFSERKFYMKSSLHTKGTCNPFTLYEGIKNCSTT